MAASYRTDVATWTTANGAKSATITTVAGDYLIAFVGHTGNVSGHAVTDNQGGTWVQVTEFDGPLAANPGRMSVWVRTALVGTGASTIVTTTPGTTAGGGLDVIAVAGMLRAGLSGIRQFATEPLKNAATPAPVFASAPLTANMVLGFASVAANPAALTPRTSFTERQDLGYATPAAGLHTMTRDSGETATTQTWGSAASAPFGSVVVELDITSADATFSTVVGVATADGGSTSMVGDATFATAVGVATADGGSTSFTGAATFTTTVGDTTASGGSTSFGVGATFDTAVGVATTGGGSTSFTGDATFATVVGDTTASGGSSSFTGAAGFTTTAGSATASGGSTSFSGNATFSTTVGSATASGGSTSFTATRDAVASDTVVDSLGMACFYTFRAVGNPWREDAAVTALLIELGIRHIRQNWSAGSGATAVRDNALALANSDAHTKVLLRVLDRDDTQTLAQQKVRVQGFIDDVVTLWAPSAPDTADLRTVISGWEGVNEPDHYTAGGAAWIGNTQRAQQAIWETVRDPAQLKHIAETDVVGPSITNISPGITANFASVGNLSQWTTRACLHVYPQGLPSEGIDSDMAAAAPSYPDDEPFTISEGGYHDDMTYTGPGDPQPADVINSYAPRHLFEHVIRGNRIYWYTFMDQPTDSSAGYDSKSDSYGYIAVPNEAGQPGNWVRKALFYTMKRLLAIYDDYGASFTPAGLGVTVSAPADPLIKSHLSQRSNGQWLLALWRDKSLYNNGTSSYVTVSPVDVTVTLSGSVAVETSTPSVDGTSDVPVWTSEGTVSSVVVPVDGDLTVVRIGDSPDGSFTTTAGQATASGGSTSFAGNATFSTVAGDATASGGSTSFSGTTSATFSTTVGEATASGGSTDFLTGVIFSTLTGDTTASGGSTSFAGGADFNTVVGLVTGDGGSTSFLGGGTFTTTVGEVIAGGGVTTETGDAVFGTLVGAATASGGAAAWFGFPTGPPAAQTVGQLWPRGN